MKILIVCQHFYPEQFRINDIAFKLVERGHDVTVLTGLPNYPTGKIFKGYRWFKKRNEIINGVKIKRVSIPGRGNSIFKMALNYMAFAFFGKIRTWFIKKDFDLVYVYEISPITMAWPAITVKKIKKIPLILHCLDQWPISVTTGGIKESSLIYKILYKISASTYKKCDVITVSSRSFQKYFEDVLKITKKDKKLLYWPSYAEETYSNIIHKKNEDFDLVFAGNIGPAQSVETIVECARILNDKKDIKFHIIGDGLNRENCEKLASKYKLDNIKFYGYFPVEDMPKFYSLADAFLITMVDNYVVNSTLPAKVQSYMLAKRPILGAISGEVKNVIQEADCGLCCDSLDYDTLAKIILEAKNNNKLNEWSENAYQYYKKNFDSEYCMDKLEDIMYHIKKEYKGKSNNEAKHI